MATKVVMEALSPTMEEGRLVEWKKNEGDPVAVGDVLADIPPRTWVIKRGRVTAESRIESTIHRTAPVHNL